VVSLNDLSAQIGGDDVWAEERMVIDRLVAETQRTHPSFLAEATGEWNAPYIDLIFGHEDGTVVEVTHGDGYTAIRGAGMAYRGYLDTRDLIAVLIAATRGEMTYVEHSRLGYKVGDYFEVEGREGRLGYSRPGLGFVPFLLGAVPGVPETVRRTRVTFVATPSHSAT
jgi:hypothetical protein